MNDKPLHVRHPLNGQRRFANHFAGIRLLLPGMDAMSLSSDWAESRDTVLLVAMGVAVGIMCGLAAYAFAWLINEVSHVFFAYTWLSGFSPLARGLIIVLAPALGGLIVGPLIHVFAREARGHGVPAVMRALAEQGGIIKPNVALVKTLASAITLGSGGSAGREGPIVQIGAALGSAVGQICKVSESHMRTLVICGAAGGIAAIFNAPFAGVFYGTEVLLQEFEARAISVIVLTAVTASVVIRMLEGNHPAFNVPSYTLVSPIEMGPYVILGILAGLVSVLFIVGLYAAEDGFHALRIPIWLKPALGGLCVGLVGLFYPLNLLPYPSIFGSTYVPIGAAVANQIGVGLLVALLFGKLLATALTLGSGGSGGVFGPSLFLGSMVGGAFGFVVHSLLPGVTAPPGAYALVGMAAVLGAAGHAPITGIMLAFEMVDNYQMILPLMVTTVIAFMIARFLARESIDTLALVRAGVTFHSRVPTPPPPSLLQATTVGEVMSHDYPTVPPAMSLDDLARRFNETGHHGFPVVDGEDRLLGMVTLSDFENTILQQPTTTNGDVAPVEKTPRRVSDIMTTDLAIAYPTETLEEALRTLALRNVGRLPVVVPGNPERMLGLLRRNDIIAAFRRQDIAPPIAAADLHIGAWGGTRFLELALAANAPAIDHAIRDLASMLPSDTLLVAIRRAHRGQVLLPRGDTVLRAGDVVIVVTRPQYEAETRKLFESPSHSSLTPLA